MMSDGLISQLAISLDSVSGGKDCIFVIAATNRPDILEPALLRPGRFDQLIYIPLPDRNARLGILKAALRKAPLSNDVDLCYLAEHTNGLSGADLKEICQRACKFAIRDSIEKRSLEPGTATTPLVGGGSSGGNTSPPLAERNRCKSGGDGGESELFSHSNSGRGDGGGGGVDGLLEVTRSHFEVAMSYSRRSVGDTDLYRFEHFNRLLQQIAAKSFSFPPVVPQSPP
jgi:transitional endoplasmic reticulum ATPase